MSESKFNWIDAIAMMVVVLVMYHLWNRWYVDNTDYIERYAECLEWNQAQFPDWSMDQYREMCDTTVTPDKEKAQ